MFKTMTGVLNKSTSPTDEDIQKIPSFIFCRWLSGNPYAIIAANQINYYYDIPIENQYNIVKSAFAGKIKYIPYPKKEHIDVHENVVYLSKYFNVTEDKAKDYLEFIDEEELTMIADLYKG